VRHELQGSKFHEAESNSTAQTAVCHDELIHEADFLNPEILFLKLF
jgi:hypothetical protein